MYQLFRPQTHFNKGTVLPGQVDFIQRTFQEKLVALRNYYREKTFYIRNDHLLVRLLITGMGSLRTDYQTFVWVASDRSDALCRHFQLTGSASYGKIRYGEFYGEGSYEIIVGDDAYFDVNHAVNNWKDLTPVKVLGHAISDFGLTLPNGKDNHFVEGLATIYINIPMLFLQYRMFVEEQQRRGDEGIISEKLFINRYVLPGMMVSHLDHVFMNRIMNLHSGAPMTESLIRSPFFQAETGLDDKSGISSQVNRTQESVLEKITKSQITPEQALTNIFTVTEPSAYELLKMPQIAPTRQFWWAYLLTRLKHVKFLLEIGIEADAHQNRMYQNKIILELTRLLDSHVLEKMFTAELLESTIIDIQDVLSLAKK